MTLDLPGPGAAFTAQNAHLAAIFGAETLKDGPVTAEGHRDLAPGLWLSTEPGTGARLSLTPGIDRQGARLTLESGGRSRWAALGWSLPVEALDPGADLGLALRMSCHGLVCCRPALRHLLRDGGLQDVFAADYAVGSGGTLDVLWRIATDPRLLEASRAAEVNLFFHGAEWDARIEAIGMRRLGR